MTDSNYYVGKLQIYVLSALPMLFLYQNFCFTKECELLWRASKNNRIFHKEGKGGAETKTISGGSLHISTVYQQCVANPDVYQQCVASPDVYQRNAS